MIEVENLTFYYKKADKPSIKNISLKVSKGESFVIMGHTGAGKSTLLLTFNGVIPMFLKGKFDGKVIIDGVDTSSSNVPELSAKVGIVFQDFESQLFSTNVELEAAFLPENLGIDRTEMKERIQKYITFVGLSDFMKRQPAELSGGEKQRLAIASVLTGEPVVLCLDEPTTDLDSDGKRRVLEIAKSLQEEKNVTLVMVEHDTEEITGLDKIALMKNGEILCLGKPSEILTKVELLESIGIKPPQVTEYFHSRGSDLIPVDIAEAKIMFKAKNYNFDHQKYNELLIKDEMNKNRKKESQLEIKELRFKYSQKSPFVLTDINLEIAKGEYVAILGGNGSGKTTLIKHFNGLLKPTEGDVLVNGINTKDMKIHDLGKIVGYVFQNPDHQIFSEKVWDEIAFGPKQLGFTKNEVEENVIDALKAVDLENAKDADPFTLTKGERQRVAVASALASRTDVIIFDEPTTGLDYKELQGMLSLLKKLHEDGHTIIIVTHSIWVAAENAQRFIIMKNGKIIKDGLPREVLSDVDSLAEASLKLPQISQLSLAVAGKLVLSVDEMLYCT